MWGERARAGVHSAGVTIALSPSSPISSHARAQLPQVWRGVLVEFSCGGAHTASPPFLSVPLPLGAHPPGGLTTAGAPSSDPESASVVHGLWALQMRCSTGASGR